MEDIISGTYFADDTGKIMVVKLQGYIDQTNSFSLQKVFNDIINSGCHNVIIDFSEVMYISSAGWGIFVGEIKHFRDEGGDIKLANMSPDIYEVYQMLEFYHIFEDFSSMDEAKKSFLEFEPADAKIAINDKEQTTDLEIELDNEKSIEENLDNVLEISMANDKSENDEIHQDEIKINIESTEEVDILIDENVESGTNSIDVNEAYESKPKMEKEKSIIDLSRLPLHEKIKKLVAEYPLLSVWKIKNLLKDKRFGSVKISIFKLYKTLKELDLESKIKRYRYYRSS